MANSRHHQAADPAFLAPPLRAAAWTPDGSVVEALEAPEHPWFLGVQWHPERPQDSESYEASRPLFAAFVEACRNGKHD
ncbi:MAG: gamma-glutamyl-gamma-aminobutyrate hydrolase family protein [Armatimonadota bacterium]|nr:gamma-glutamyl-gamma-aminobutyrate hydrolase family protein [Armatimonadota bacterium]